MKFSVPLKENHKALWNWLAKNPDKEKHDWPGWKTILGLNAYPLPSWAIRNECFACGEASAEMLGSLGCEKCPCDWEIKRLTGFAPCEKKGSLYQRWRKVRNKTTRSRLALKIAEAWR